MSFSEVDTLSEKPIQESLGGSDVWPGTIWQGKGERLESGVCIAREPGKASPVTRSSR